MKEFCTYVNPHYNQDWAFIKFLPNIQHIFGNFRKHSKNKQITDCSYFADKLKTHYFEPVGMKVSYDVAWDSRIISDGSDYKIFLTERKIFVNTITLGFRPRIVLFSTLFHALVHLYLFEISMGQIAINSHDENFRSIMLFLNKKLKTEFTTSHKFFGSNPTLHNQGNWYHCKGACVNYEPFYGIVRCTNDEPPSQNNKFWNDHMDCGGGFFKVMEVIRSTNNNDIEKEFVTSIRYQTPKPHQSTSKEKTNIKAREMVDLTDDTNQVQVQNLMEVIDLDDSEFIEEADAASIVFASKFMAQRSAIFTKCSICQRTIGGFAFASHVDYCFGQSKQNVVFPGLASIDSLAMLKCPSAKKRKI